MNELTTERLAEIKRRIHYGTLLGASENARKPMLDHATLDLPLLVAAYEEQGKELGLLSDNLKAFRAEHLRLEHLLGLAMQSAACTNGETILDGVQRIKRDVAGMQSDLSAAQKRIGELEGLVVDATVALRLLHDHQNGCPLPKYEEHWNEAMRLTELVLPKLEALTTPPQ